MKHEMTSIRHMKLDEAQRLLLNILRCITIVLGFIQVLAIRLQMNATAISNLGCAGILYKFRYSQLQRLFTEFRELRVSLRLKIFLLLFLLQ